MKEPKLVVKMKIDKETKHQIRYATISGKDDVPTLTNVYLPKWFVGDTKVITVTVEEG